MLGFFCVIKCKCDDLNPHYSLSNTVVSLRKTCLLILTRDELQLPSFFYIVNNKK